MEPREKYLLKRRKLKLTLKEIAEYLGVSISMVSRYELGERNFTLENEYMNYIDNKEIEMNPRLIL